MAAPSGTIWGSAVQGSKTGRQGRIGVYTNVTETTDTQIKVNIQVWFWTIYSCSDGSNNFYCDIGTGVSSATTKIGSVDINHTVNTGDGWSTSNQTRLYNVTKTYTRGTSAATYKVYAKYNGIDMLGKTMSVNTSFTVPALAKYTISYNANGGSGAPSSQSKYHGKSLTLSSTKPTRNGYSFLGWSTSNTATSATYSAGGSYTTNASDVLYAVWKADTYTVSYNANGGSGAPANQTKTYGVNLTLSSTKPTRTNYTFLGWSTSKTATSATYKAGGSYTANSAITLYAVWKLAYTKPTIKITSVTWVKDTVGTITGCKVAYSWSCMSGYLPTGMSLAYNSVSDSGTQSITKPSALSGNSTVTITHAFNPALTYTFVLTLTDSQGSYTASKAMSSTPYTIHCRPGGKGVAFGKTAEMDNYADFGYEVCMNNNLRIAGRDLEGNPVEAFQPINSNGNTVIGWGNYDKGAGNTNVYGNGIRITANDDIILAINNGEHDFRPYRRTGDSISLSLYTSGYITNGSKYVHFWIPMSVPIIGQPTITVTSNKGMQLRQGTKYTHGSSASVCVTPDKYTVERHAYNGIHVQAEFSNITDATNNDSIGVYWDGTITFS